MNILEGTALNMIFFGLLGFQAAYRMVRGNNYAHLKLLFSNLDWTQTCIWVSVESCDLQLKQFYSLLCTENHKEAKLKKG